MFTILNRESPPCGTCHSQCCKEAPITRPEMERIVGYLRRNVSDEVGDKLRKQERPPGKCPFVDMETHRCIVYPVRPFVCSMFGRTPRLTCLFAPHLADEVDDNTSLWAIEAIMRKGKQYAILGIDVTWKELK